MIDTTIWRDPSLSHLGYTTAKLFECDAGHVAIGKTASAAEPFKSIITFNAYGITVVDDRPSTVAYFLSIDGNDGKEQYMLRAILAALTPELFTEIISRIKADAINKGKDIARSEMRQALGIHGFD